jgi:hypothetical protein
MATTAPVSRPEFLTVGAAAQRLGMSANSVKRRLAAGVLRGYKASENGYHYVTAASVESLLLHRRQLQEAAMMPGRGQGDPDRWAPPSDEDQS